MPNYDIAPAEVAPVDPATEYASVKNSIGSSVVRTVVPLLVGLLVTALAKIHLTVDSMSLTSLVTLAISTTYYTVVRVLETKVHAAWGWLLGKAVKLHYVK